MTESIMDRPRTDTAETIPAKRNAINSPNTQGISMKPIKNVTDPHSIRVNEAPSSSEANPAGVICGDGLLDEQEGDAVGGAMRDDSAENEIGVWDNRRRLRTKAESSYRTPDCWPSHWLGVMFAEEIQLSGEY